MRAKLIIFCIVILVSFLNLNLFSEKLNVAYKIENDNIYKPVKIIVYEKEIYLLDLADQSIKVFDKKGVLKRSFGKKGEGPSEIKNATDFSVFKGKVYILDSSGRKFELFSVKDGKHLGSKKFIAFNPIKFIISKGSFFISTLSFQPGQKIIKKFEDNTDNSLKSTLSFMNCIPMRSDDFSVIYNNFGFITEYKEKIYFAYTVTNKVVEYRKDGKKLREFILPLKPIDLKKEISKGNTILKTGVNFDIRNCDGELFLLANNIETRQKKIFKLVKNKFKQLYTIEENIISFDIDNNELFGLNFEDSIVFVYKLKK
jgi:hypothetical protein